VTLAACRPLPPEPLVADVDIRGVPSDISDELSEGLATTETPLLFGLFPRVLEYATYDSNVLARDLLRIERALRARGYYEAKVTVARVVRDGHSVRVQLEVVVGQQVLVTRIDPGLSSLPFELMATANRAREMAEGDVLDEEALEADRTRIERTLRDAGYAFSKVEAKAEVDLPTHAAAIQFSIDPGKKARLGPISIVGLEEIPERPVRANLGLTQGEPYNESDLLDAQQALISLGVFSTVEVVPDRSQPDTQIVPVVVRVRENLLRSLQLGGGVRFDVLRLGANLTAGWQHKNFLGGMRHLSLKAEPGVTLFPTRISWLKPWTRYLPEYRLSAELKQPAFLEGRTTGVLSTTYNVGPLLYPLGKDFDPKTERVIGYHELSASARVERAFFNHHLQVTPSYNWQARFPFSYQGPRPQLDSLIISFPALTTTLAFVDNPLSPRSGFSISNTVEVAGYIFGGTVDDVRVAPEIKSYLPIGKSVLAVRLAFGFLFPNGYGSLGLNPPSDPDGQYARAVRSDQQKLLFRAFYSGGPNSNRGYPYRAVGPHATIGFLVPTGVNCEPQNGTPLENLDSRCIRPIGGLTMWEASIEARIPLPVDMPLGVVVFVDASDVTRGVASIRTNVPHLSPGVGLRYMTPIGPVRLDVGWRVPGAQYIGKSELPPDEGRPGDPIFGFFPGAVHLMLFEAF